MAILLRPLRVARRDPAWLDATADELAVSFARIFGGDEAVHITVGADGLFHEGRRMVDYSPREDPLVFRLFQHGVRQISVFLHVTRDDLRAVLDLLTTDLDAAEHQEDDFATLLASREIPSVQFLVVE